MTAEKEKRIAKVIVDLSLDKAFDYLISDQHLARIHVGVQVKVPFGRSSRRGYVLDIVENSEYPRSQLKQIASLCETHTQIPKNLVELGKWMAQYYCCSREQAVRTLLPRAIRSGKVKQRTLKHYAVADTKAAENFVIENTEKKPAKNQISALKTLLHHQELAKEQLILEAQIKASTIKTLLKKQLITESERVVHHDAFEHLKVVRDRPLEPTVEQSKALEAFARMMKPDAKEHVMLLHGVTNSGKTEVYLQAISRVIECGKEAIVLVPEISLTPQTVRRFRARFGDMVSVLHSRLSERERFDEWSRINEGLVKIVVGARSALFAPFRKLGLIIVDEEHEGSYKQAEAPRYNARDVAVMRGKQDKAIVILGSATPSFESYYNALGGQYILVEMLKRVDDCVMPKMLLADMRLETFGDDDEDDTPKNSLFSKDLLNAIYDRLKRGEQSILFLNRRGFARQMMCEHCGYVAECADCSIAYTYHMKRQSLSCHLCGNAVRAFEICPECGAADIRYSGSGTEKIENVLGKLFPHANIARMDSDTMRSHSAYEKVLNSFRRGDLDILVGTQMIAKGLHFPNVTLVGVLNADQGLYIPDFRAPERTFQLLTQVAGRAGRGDIKGEVIIQTRKPEHETIQLAIRHDFRAFFNYDLEVREMLEYPPCGHLIAVFFQGMDNLQVRDFALRFSESIRPHCHEKIRVSEVAPAPIERIKGKYRYLLIFRGEHLKKLRAALRYHILHMPRDKNIDVYADVDALNLM